jgi:hypothetical protein
MMCIIPQHYALNEEEKSRSLPQRVFDTRLLRHDKNDILHDAMTVRWERRSPLCFPVECNRSSHGDPREHQRDAPLGKERMFLQCGGHRVNAASGYDGTQDISSRFTYRRDLVVGGLR